MASSKTLPPNDTLYLIDGHAQIFRAYYAIRGGMTSPVTGEPTNAVFAFTGMLLKLFEQFHPQYVIMAVDTPGKTFRDEMYSDYKATREAPPDDFAPQVPRIFEVTRLFGIPILGQSGAEADDIIATITQRVLDEKDLAAARVRIVSKDKDLEQLLGPRVTMFDIHTDTTIDAAALHENKGITPEQVVDVLALCGDNVDNIPGVEGVGPKTAAKLVHEFGSIDGVLANLDKIKGKRHDNIEKARDRLPLNVKLVTLKRDLAIDFDMAKARVGGIDATALRRLFADLGFRRHSSDLDRLLQGGGEMGQSAQSSTLASKDSEASTSGGGQLSFAASLFDAGPSASTAADVSAEGHSIEATSTAAEFDYRAVTAQADLDDLAATLARQKRISVDTETVGLGHRAGLCGICLAWEPGHGVYVPTLSPSPADHLDQKTVLAALGPLLEDAALPKCGHNLKYDLLVLRHAGVEMRGVAFDSMIASHLLGMPSHGMDALALAVLKHQTIPISQLIGAGGRGMRQKTMDKVPLDQVTPYAAEDADITLRLCQAMGPMLDEMGLTKLAHEVEMPLVEVLAEMEFNGIRIDPDELSRQKEALGRRIIDLRDQIHDAAGGAFNIDSPKQLADVLFKQLELPVVKRTKTGPSTDIEVLEKLAEMDDLPASKARVPKLIVEYRQLTKLVSTYLVALADSIDKKTGRVHATFHQTGAATGRLSSSGPNMQNIPIRTEVGRQIRKAFVAEPGHVLISADYSQIELRILAHLSQDPALIDAFAKDMDIHTAVACQVFNIAPDEVTPEQRTHAKTINFGIVYGVTPFGLARRIDGLDVEGARKLIEDYKKRFAGISVFLQECVQQALNEGYVTTILGRRRPIPQINSRNPSTRSLGERLAINSVVQGSAADLIKLAMVNLHRRIKDQQLPMKMLLQIHDELVMETPKDAADDMSQIVRHEMEHAMTLKVPLKVDAGAGTHWLDAK